MKLQYEKEKLLNKSYVIFGIVFIFTLLLISSIIVYINITRYLEPQISLMMLSVVFLAILMPIFLMVLIMQRRNDKNLKDIGEKISASIVATGVIKYRYRGHEDVYYITVSY